METYENRLKIVDGHVVISCFHMLSQTASQVLTASACV